MSAPWLQIVGIGEDGMDGLSSAARTIVNSAEVIVGGDRHHKLSDNVEAERLSWPHPFDALIDTLEGLRGRRVVVLATGDPLWFSVGARIGRALDPKEISFHPQVSAFQLASVRMGWSMADLETLTVHGRPVETMIAFIQPDARLLILTTGAETPAKIAAFLNDRGFGRSKITVLAAMGGENEARFDGTAHATAAQGHRTTALPIASRVPEHRPSRSTPIHRSRGPPRPAGEHRPLWPHRSPDPPTLSRAGWTCR